MRLFLTGNPGVGKTTVIRAVAERLEGLARAGFYTEEIREGGQRSGFRIVTLDGRQGTLASVGSRKPTVGRYTVHVEEFEKLVLPSLEPVTQADLYVIDEIGKMELRSAQFRARIMALLQQPTNLLASASKKADGLIDRIRRRRDVEVIEVTRQNRDALAEQLVKRIKTALGK
jgi:nucleoside-triphosphatase